MQLQKGNWTKLDKYDYEVEDLDHGRLFKIYIYFGMGDDACSADILTQVSQNDDQIYVEGHYYRLLNADVFNDGEDNEEGTLVLDCERIDI